MQMGCYVLRVYCLHFFTTVGKAYEFSNCLLLDLFSYSFLAYSKLLIIYFLKMSNSYFSGCNLLLYSQ